MQYEQGVLDTGWKLDTGDMAEVDQTACGQPPFRPT